MAEVQQCAALQVTHVVSQSDVVKLLWANKAVLGEALAKTVEQLELDDVSGVGELRNRGVGARKGCVRFCRANKAVLDDALPKTVEQLELNDISELHGEC